VGEGDGQVKGFGVWSLGFGVWGLEFGVWSLEFGVVAKLNMVSSQEIRMVFYSV
jgi:hypothetical protein